MKITNEGGYYTIRYECVIRTRIPVIQAEWSTSAQWTDGREPCVTFYEGHGRNKKFVGSVSCPGMPYIPPDAAEDEQSSPDPEGVNG